MTFGDLIFWIIVAIIAYFLIKAGLAILIVIIAVVVVYYLYNLIFHPEPRQSAQRTEPVGEGFRLGADYGIGNPDPYCVGQLVQQGYDPETAVWRCAGPA